MIRPKFEKWQQSAEDVRKLSIEAEHRRSRERFQALYQIGTKQTDATKWSKQIGRNARTVMEWVHNYNRYGPSHIYYQHTGGPSPLLTKKSERKSSKRSGTLSQ